MASLYLQYPEDGVDYIAPELSKEETLEYLIKVFSRTFVEAAIDDKIYHDHIKDSYCIFAAEGIPGKTQDLINLDYRMSNPEFMGRIVHLASHIRHTRFNGHISDQESPKRDLLWWLEDLRAEKRFLDERRLDTRNVREYWTAKMANLEKVSSYSALDISLTYLATVGRSYSGVVLREEADEFRKRFVQKVPDSTLDHFDSLIERYLNIDDQSDGVEASLVAQEWLDLTDAKISPEFQMSCMDGVPVLHLVMSEASGSIDDAGQPGMKSDSASEQGESEESSKSSANDDSSSESDFDVNSSPEDEGDDGDSDVEDAQNLEDQEGDSSPNQDVKSSDKSLSEDRIFDDFTQVMKENDLADEDPKVFEPPAFDVERYKSKTEDDNARAQALRMADKVFPKDALVYKTRPPTPEDHNLASSLVVTFRKARWRAPSKTRVTSKTPPGRLSSRAAVTVAAQRSMGIPVTAEPFRQTVRKRVEGPPPIVGMACDISGSMKESAAPMAQIIWASSRAVPRAGGKFAAVSFGSSVKSLVLPGSKPNQVPVINAIADDHKAFEAISALTGGLNLLGNTDGVKILIISSDGIWSKQEKEKSVALLKRLEKYGVHVFWIPFQKKFWMRNHVEANQRHNILVPFMEVGSVLEFDRPSDVPRELAKLIAKKIEQG